jgi:hypothetical protein
VFVLVSCDKEIGPQYVDGSGQVPLENGFWLVNEGNFNQGNASLSFYNLQEKKIANYVFKAQNNRPLGDVFQSMAQVGDQWVLSINNGNQLIVCDQDMNFLKTINGLETPRYILPIDDKNCLVTSLKGNIIYKVNIQYGSIQKFYDADAWTEKIYAIENEIFVAQKQIGFQNSPNNKILKLNKQGALISEYLMEKNIKDFLVKNNELYVLVSNDSQTFLEKVNVQNNKKESFELQGNYSFLSFSDNNLYLAGGKTVGKWNKSNQKVDFLFNVNKVTYGFLVENEQIYLSDAKDYVRKGNLLIYNQKGLVLDSLETGLIPSQLYKK